MGYTVWLLFWENDFLSMIMSLKWGFDKLLILGVVIAMSFINWGLEVLKWHTAIKPITLSICYSMKSVLVGVAIGLITPARMGEYIGRMLYITDAQRMWSGIATFRCSLAQSVITYSSGILSFLYLSMNGHLVSSIGIDSYFFLTLCIIILAVMLISFIKLDRVLPWINKLLPFYWKQKLRLDLTSNEFEVAFSDQSQLLILLYACLRYTVYLTQYGIVLSIIGVHLSLLELVTSISLVFLIQSLLPVPSIAKIFARTGAAAGVFSILGYGTLEIITASLLIWVINLLLPALCGLAFLLKLKKKKA